MLLITASVGLLLLGVLARQPTRYWVFAALAVGVHYAAGVLFARGGSLSAAADGSLTRMVRETSGDGTLATFLVVPEVLLRWVVPLWLARAGYTHDRPRPAPPPEPDRMAGPEAGAVAPARAGADGEGRLDRPAGEAGRTTRPVRMFPDASSGVVYRVTVAPRQVRSDAGGERRVSVVVFEDLDYGAVLSSTVNDSLALEELTDAQLQALLDRAVE